MTEIRDMMIHIAAQYTNTPGILVDNILSLPVGKWGMKFKGGDHRPLQIVDLLEHDWFFFNGELNSDFTGMGITLRKAGRK